MSVLFRLGDTEDGTRMVAVDDIQESLDVLADRYLDAGLTLISRVLRLVSGQYDGLHNDDNIITLPHDPSPLFDIPTPPPAPHRLQGFWWGHVEL